MIECVHLDQVSEMQTPASECVACVEAGDSWIHLRMCLTCSHVGCCDSSKNQHATRHHHTTNHPIVASMEPGEAWAWCYIDQILLETETDE